MSRQLNLRVSEEFAQRLERVARRVGQPMAAVLESVGTPALEAAEADALFEAEALVAWEEYQLSGCHVTTATIDALFDDAVARAKKGATGEKE
jgi:predicted transcriptional regulator